MDGAGTGVEPLIDQLLAQEDDLVLGVDRSPVGPGCGPARAGPEGLVATFR